MAQTNHVLPTIGEIARRLGVPVHRVEYVIRTRGVRPCGWAGNARVFTDEEVDRIAAEIHSDRTSPSRRASSLNNDVRAITGFEREAKSHA